MSGVTRVKNGFGKTIKQLHLYQFLATFKDFKEIYSNSIAQSPNNERNKPVCQIINIDETFAQK